MSDFRTGRFDKTRVSPAFQRFCPIRAEASIHGIDPAELAKAGKRLVLLDVDNTLLAWRSEDIPQSTHDWVDQARAAGLQMCILSNTRHPERLDRLSKKLGIPYHFGKFKPSTVMYLKALEQFQVKPEEAVMIGDQIFTDVLGANRSGIEAIWVRQMAPVDFFGTKISRLGERLLRKRLYRAMVEEIQQADGDGPEEGPAEEDLAVGGTAAFDLFQHPTVRQFVKFVIIGAVSTAIDKGLYMLLMFYVPAGHGLLSDQLGSSLLERFPTLLTGLATKEGVLIPKLAAGPVFVVFTSTLAIFNSFVWNRRWTFKIGGKEHRAVQLRKFFTIALIGTLLNMAFTAGFSNIIPGHEKRSVLVASAIATVVVAFWNFFGQKLWTFKK